MKTQQEINKLAEQEYPIQLNENHHKPDIYDDLNEEQRIAFKNGYTQCQKDIVEELKEWIEITLSAESKLGASDNVIEALLGVKYKIESLNKQD